MKKLLEAIKHPETAKVTAYERMVLGAVKHVSLEKDFIIKQSMYLAVSDSQGQEIDRTNLIHRMANIVRKRMKGKIVGLNRFGQAELFVSVAQQLYWLEQAEEVPCINEAFAYGFDGNIKTYVRPQFLVVDLSPKNDKDSEPRIPLYRKCRDTIYRPGHVLGRAWDIFAYDLMGETLMINKYTPSFLEELYLRSSDYNDMNRKESQSDRIVRARAAIEYLTENVCGRPLTFSAVPDSRSRVASYKIFFSDTKEELDVSHTWFINFYGEGWQTALYERYEQYEVTEAGLEDALVALARGWHKANTSSRLSWRKAKILFKKHTDDILTWASGSFKHGVYYPRLSKLYKAGVGTMTGFMIEADLSASGIGSAALNIRSKPMAVATALAGSATPADAHRGVVTDILLKVTDEKTSEFLIHKFYKLLKKKNVEVTHAQSVKVTADAWNRLLVSLQVQVVEEFVKENPDATDEEIDANTIVFGEVTPDIISEVYDRLMPGLLTWIEAMTSITQVGVSKGYPVLYFTSSDGVKCASSAYTESRMFKSRAVDKNLNSKTITFQMRMPIEVINKRIVWDSFEHGKDAKLKNKMMGIWANLVQADDAEGMRIISALFKAIFGYVPIVKHDGYHVKLGDVKQLTECTYEWRKHQLVNQPMKKAFHSIADFLNIKRIELPEGSMTLADFKFTHVGEAPFMMT